MTYKHQNDAIDAVDFMKPSYGDVKHQEIQQELAEVYRKAEAYDESEIDTLREIKRMMEDYIYGNKYHTKRDLQLNYETLKEYESQKDK